MLVLAGELEEAFDGVVGLRDDGFTDLGECKWGRVASKPRLEQELAEKIASYPNPRRATLAGRLFVRNKPTSGTGSPAPFRWHDQEDLYAED